MPADRSMTTVAPQTAGGDLGGLGGKSDKRSGSAERRPTFNKSIAADGPQLVQGDYKGNDGNMTLEIIS